MSPRRSAFLDVGTNTILCLIAEIRDTGRFRVLEDLAAITRLGEDVDRTRRIGAAAESRGLAALKRYREHCDNLGVEEIIAVGTSALRDAENSAEVCDRFREQLGFDIRIISGAEEAAYAFLAVQRGLCLSGKEILVIDVGGGSTEMICGNQAGLSRAVSLDLGSVRLTERFLASDPAHPDEMARMNAAIEEELDRLPSYGLKPDSGFTLVGIAATFTTLAAMEKKMVRYSHSEVHGSTVTIEAVCRQRERLQRKTIAERRCIVGLEPERADVMLAGAALIERIMMRYQAGQVVVSDQGVRYGLLHETARPL